MIAQVKSLLIERFIDELARENLLRVLEYANSTAARVYGKQSGGGVDVRVRSAERLDPGSEARAFVIDALTRAKRALSAHFNVELTSCEEPQFLRYRAGDYFVAHQDGNTPLVRDDTVHRRVSVVLFLNDTFEGGALVFHGAYPHYDYRYEVPAAPGSLVAFPSETTHEVTPVTHGCRYSVASWFR